MSTQTDNSVIHRKAMHGRESFDARAMSWSKALRLSLERCADQLLGLALVVRAVEQVRVPLDTVPDRCDGDWLILGLEGRGDAQGALLLDRAFAQSLIDVQTRGKVQQAEPPDRPFTDTDAAVAGPMVDAVLATLDSLMADTPSPPDPLNLRFTTRAQDTRALMLDLDAPEFDLFQVTLDIAAGLRSATVLLALPSDLLRAAPPAAPTENGTAFDLSGPMLSAPISLDAVLTRVQMPLSQIAALKPGGVVPLPRAQFGQAELTGPNGFLVARAALGKMNGFRALRIGAEDLTTRPALPDGLLTKPDDRPTPQAEPIITPEDLPDTITSVTSADDSEAQTAAKLPGLSTESPPQTPQNPAEMPVHPIKSDQT